MSKSLVRNMGYTFLTIIILLFVLVPNFQVVLMTICCVAFTVVNVVGFAHFMGLTIETVTSIITILSLGLAVDYCAHIDDIVGECCVEGREFRETKNVLCPSYVRQELHDAMQWLVAKDTRRNHQVHRWCFVK